VSHAKAQRGQGRGVALLRGLRRETGYPKYTTLGAVRVETMIRPEGLDLRLRRSPLPAGR